MTGILNIIGVRRLAILIILIVVNTILSALYYLYLMPESLNSQTRLQTLQGEISTLRGDIDKIAIEFDQMNLQQAQFDTLKKQGFFGVQLRSDAKDKFTELQKKSGVISAVANVGGGAIEENDEAAKAKHKVLLSSIEIDIKAFDDSDIYRYLYLAERTFLGHLSIEAVTISRIKDVNAPVLRAIATGMNPELVTAHVVLSWRTMIPEDQVIAEENKG